MQSALDNGLTYIASVDEALLVNRLRAGDERAFEDLVRMFGGRLLAVARRFVRNDESQRNPSRICSRRSRKMGTTSSSSLTGRHLPISSSNASKRAPQCERA